MKISFDLDNVIFDLMPTYKLAFQRAGKKFIKPTDYDIEKIYDADICQKLAEIWADDILYTMPVLDKKIPYILNNLMARPGIEVCFVTERRLKQPEKSFQQLKNAGINCKISQVYDMPGLKSDILKDLVKPDIHFDDSPKVVKGCLKRSVPIVMISNDSTPYNHHMRNQVEYYNNLCTALTQKGFCK